MTDKHTISRFCIYTMRHTQALEEAYRQGGEGSYTENKKWKTGSKLFLEAQQRHERMPVFFSSAEMTDSSSIMRCSKTCRSMRLTVICRRRPIALQD